MPERSRRTKPHGLHRKSRTRRGGSAIDAALSGLRPAERAALEKLRGAIRAAAPRAEECLSYRLPAFRLDGKILVAFGARASHCALYPMSASTVRALARELRSYDTSEGTIRFAADRPLPASLVRKVVRARIAENADRQRLAKERASARRRSPRR
jgi:uncharacterized protein YdhG (YjbR/CyaY superfamily)